MVISYSRTKNIDVIVLDHHQAETNLPNAYSLINPNSGLFSFIVLFGCIIFIYSGDTTDIYPIKNAGKIKARFNK